MPTRSSRAADRRQVRWLGWAVRWRASIKLRQENPEYGALADERDQIIAQLPPNATAIAMQGGPEADRIRAQQDRYDEIRQRMSDIASQTDLFATAQRNPDIQSYENQGALEQGVVAAAAAPEGLASGLPRAAASVAIDPGSAPFLGLQAAGDLVRGAGHLLSPVASDVAGAADTPLSLTVRNGATEAAAPLTTAFGGAQPARAALPFATTLGGAAAGGKAANRSAVPRADVAEHAGGDRQRPRAHRRRVLRTARAGRLRGPAYPAPARPRDAILARKP